MHQVDSREVVPTAEMGEGLRRHLFCAELPTSNSSVRDL